MRLSTGIGGGWLRLSTIAGCVACVTALVAIGAAGASPAPRRTAPPPLSGKAREIDQIIRQGIRAHDLHAVLLQVTVGGRPLISKAYGMSMTGVPATLRMHFRNGGVAITYMSTLLLRLVDQRKVKLSDPVSKWLPWLRDSRRVTLGMLAGMSAGYHDYEEDRGLADKLYADPFAFVSTSEQLRLALSKQIQFKPGTNFSYSHSDYVILGLALAKITHEPLAVALSKQVLRPLGLTKTVADDNAPIPEPVLHAYTSERRETLGIKPSIPFLEDSTFWNPSWTLAHGAVETSDITDMTRTAIGLGSGRLLSRRSYLQQIDPRIGFGKPQDGCERCRTLTRTIGYGLGVFRSGGWLFYNPLFAGYGGLEAYLPAKRISIAVVTTFGPGSFDATGTSPNWATALFKQIAALLAPGSIPQPVAVGSAAHSAAAHAAATPSGPRLGVSTQALLGHALNLAVAKVHAPGVIAGVWVGNRGP
jgi:CubicO group peptidase (beta-lactamase class C family)